MRKTCLLLPLLVSLLVIACSSATPTPTTKQTTPAATATPTSKATVPVTTVPTAKPTAIASPSPAATTTIGGPVSFAGKTITFVVQSAAGGSTDLVARLYARFMPKHLPGNPTIVVRNIPTETVGENMVYAARPDGLTVLAGSPASIMAQLLGQSAVKYDLFKMTTVIGNAQATIIYSKPSVLDKAENIMKAKGMIFGSGSGSTQGMIFITVKEMMNFPVDKVVMAYSGSGDTRRAFLSGEINTGVDTTPSFLESILPLVKKGEVVPLFQSGILDAKGDIVQHAALPQDIMTAKQLYEKVMGKTPSGIEWDAYKGLVAAARSFDKILWLPPGAPDAINKAYWNAAEQMLKDPEQRKVIDQMAGQGTNWGAGESFDKSFKQNANIEPRVINWLKETLAKKYNVVL